MPELEAATMHLAEACGLSVAPHGLIQLGSGELAYISRRFDRIRGRRLAQEDFCQLTGKLTEGKYHGSMEKVGKGVLRWTTNSGLDALRLFELAVFCFLTGNTDMHLKNFSLLTKENGTVTLAPAYDLLPSQLLLPADREETALSMHGTKSKLTRNDFMFLAKSLSIPEKAATNTFSRLFRSLPEALPDLTGSHLPAELRQRYVQLIRCRIDRLQS